MNYKNIFKAVAFTLFLMGSATCAIAQSTAENMNMGDILKIDSPSPKFKSIHLQSHKGLPRFGAQNLYYYKNEYGDQAVNKVKSELLKQGYPNYYNLLKMKYLSNYYDDMDREYLTEITRENANNKKDIHSQTAQKYFLNLAYGISSENLLRTYFCDAKGPNCRYPRQWGGTRDEFEIQENYAAFTKENLDVLRNWSSVLFKNNMETGYMVHRYEFCPYGSPVIQYDFDQSGYWIDVFPSTKNRSRRGHQYERNRAFFREFLPMTDYGNAHLNRMTDPVSYYPKILLKISPEDAEALVNQKPKQLYAAIKVNIVFKQVGGSQPSVPHIEYTYHLADPMIEFYDDIKLTKKIGEISLKNPVYKK